MKEQMFSSNCSDWSHSKKRNLLHSHENQLSQTEPKNVANITDGSIYRDTEREQNTGKVCPFSIFQSRRNLWLLSKIVMG